MCGIFAYLNYMTPRERREIIDFLLGGLHRLEYRGYDSAGLAIDGDEGEVALLKQSGKVTRLEEEINKMKDIKMDVRFDVHCGIAHTRWATHGEPNWRNSHPQRSTLKGDFVVVHNGIVTNYNDIKKYLVAQGYEFESDTDTEAIVKLVHHLHLKFSQWSFRELVETAIQMLEGAFALVFKSRLYPGELVATRRGSPLLVGISSTTRLSTDRFPVYFSKGYKAWKSESKESLSESVTSIDAMADDWEKVHKEKENVNSDEVNPLRLANPTNPIDRSESTTEIRPENAAGSLHIEYFFASDASAVVEHTKQVLYLEDDDVASVKDGVLAIHRIKRGNDAPTSREIQMLNTELQQLMKGNFSTFMQKEIFEQSTSVIDTMRGRLHDADKVLLGGIASYVSDIRRCRRMIMIACGTSYHSCIASRQVIEELTELPVVLELASDFLDRDTPIFRDDVCFFVSQSGETADTLMALRYCKPRGALLIGVTNTVGSSICRETHCGVHINAGPEIGVASTKAYTSQIIALLMFGLVLSEDRISVQQRRRDIIAALRRLPEDIETALAMDSQIAKVAEKYRDEKSMLVMGRGYQFATCLEAALKIKELSYIHCEGIMSGELKHGPLAMVDKEKSIIMVVCSDPVYKKSLNALSQVVARGGQPLVIVDDKVDKTELPKQSTVLTVPKTVDCVQSILTIIPLQLLSYHIAEQRGCNVDRPRNLAKSVTVE